MGKKGGWIKASWSVPIAAGVGVGSYYGRLTEVSELAQGTRRFLTWNWENHEEERRQIDDWGDWERKDCAKSVVVAFSCAQLWELLKELGSLRSCLSDAEPGACTELTWLEGRNSFLEEFFLQTQSDRATVKSNQGDYYCLWGCCVRPCARLPLQAEDKVLINPLLLDLGPEQAASPDAQIWGDLSHGRTELRGNWRSGENASCTNRRAMAPNGTGATGDGGNGSPVFPSFNWLILGGLVPHIFCSNKSK